MKKIILSAIIGVCISKSPNTMAQSSDEKIKYNSNWGAVDIGYVTFNTSDDWQNKTLQSTTFGLNLFEYKLPIFKQYLGLSTGMGINFKTITFQNKYALMSNDSLVWLQTGNPTLYDTLSTVRYSQLGLGYLQVPVLLDFSTKIRQKKSIYIAAGVIGGLRMYAQHGLRGKYSNGDKFNIVTRDNDFYHTNLLNLDATVRVGYGSFGLFGTYSLTPLFHKNTATKLNPISFGVSINLDYGSDNSTESTDEGEMLPPPPPSLEGNN